MPNTDICCWIRVFTEENINWLLRLWLPGSARSALCVSSALCLWSVDIFIGLIVMRGNLKLTQVKHMTLSHQAGETTGGKYQCLFSIQDTYAVTPVTAYIFIALSVYKKMAPVMFLQATGQVAVNFNDTANWSLRRLRVLLKVRNWANSKVRNRNLVFWLTLSITWLRWHHVLHWSMVS